MKLNGSENSTEKKKQKQMAKCHHEESCDNINININIKYISKI